MNPTFISTAHGHLDHMQHTMSNWTQDMLEEEEGNLRVACDGLRTKCQTICNTLDELLDGGKDGSDSEADHSDEGRGGFNMSCLVFKCTLQDNSDTTLSKIQREANNHVNMILDSPRKEKISVAEFLACIATKNPGSRREQEDVAFVKPEARCWATTSATGQINESG